MVPKTETNQTRCNFKTFIEMDVFKLFPNAQGILWQHACTHGGNPNRIHLYHLFYSCSRGWCGWDLKQMFEIWKIFTRPTRCPRFPSLGWMPNRWNMFFYRPCKPADLCRSLTAGGSESETTPCPLKWKRESIPDWPWCVLIFIQSLFFSDVSSKQCCAFFMSFCLFRKCDVSREAKIKHGPCAKRQRKGERSRHINVKDKQSLINEL